MWAVQLYALSEGSAEVINVTVVSPVMPAVAVRQPVVPMDLEALPWVNDRDGKVRSRCRVPGFGFDRDGHRRRLAAVFLFGSTEARCGHGVAVDWRRLRPRVLSNKVPR